MPSKKSSSSKSPGSPKKKPGQGKSTHQSSKLSMPSRKVIIEASLSVLGLATAAAIIFVPSVRSSNASPSSEPSYQSSSWTDFESGPVSTEDLEPASEAAIAEANNRHIGDP